MLVAPVAMKTLSDAMGTLPTKKVIPVFAEAAFAFNVSDVMLAMDATVPMTVVPSFLKIVSPTATSVVNSVLVPVTVVDVVLVVIVPLFSALQVDATFQFVLARAVSEPAV